MRAFAVVVLTIGVLSSASGSQADGSTRYVIPDAASSGGRAGFGIGGAETLLQAAAESDELKAVVADGAGSRSLREDLARTGTGKWGEIPTSLIITAGTMLFSNQAPPPNLKHLVDRIAPRSVFFIYGQNDQDNVRELTPGYYATAGDPKAIWEVRGASHTGGIEVQSREYERRVIGFFDHALLGVDAANILSRLARPAG